MFKRIVSVIVIFALGFVAGSVTGFKAAVADYIENDAQKLEEMADSMYEEASVDELPNMLQDAIEEAEEQHQAKGFQ